MSGYVKVRCFNGKTYEIKMEENESVGSFQEHIATLSSIGVERQTLLFKGQMLESSAKLSDFGVVDGCTLNVVRRMAGANSAAKAAPPAQSAPTTTSSTAPTASDNPTDPMAANDMQAVMDALNKIGLGAGGNSPDLGSNPGGMPDLSALLSGMGAAGGAGGSAGQPDLSALLGGMGGSGASGQPDLSALLGGGGPGGAGSLDALMKQMPQMMNGLWQSEAMQDYLNDESKQEASREAIQSNPMLKQWLAADPEFAKVVNDPNKWKESMEAAKKMFAGIDGGAASSNKSTDVSSRGASATTKQTTAADIAPPHFNMPLISESYGHALGQSLVNSGLGLDLERIVRGLRNAAAGRDFPMSLPEYEKQMGDLQQSAAELVAEANQKNADKFFAEMSSESSFRVLKPGKLMIEDGPDDEVDKDAPVALESANVLVILQGRLLDGRTFFTCPAADEDAQMVHPLTIKLTLAPPALAESIVGMKEGQERTAYVHPSYCEGMSDMFGDMLPPNALLIFVLELVSSNAPEDLDVQ
uniref:peptidylprolyl isomerase n=1 Tax=Timspurckia oligopyrenoides TaxID=708627 RepID=A0A7S1ETX0_9RHOD|mmetsp:Transcript_7640/g.13842  ORF Transcript_7640/g.13842 Transcript_7640/m.13842 type:complete len:528 (+) Transcript_7640:110-1693(+)